MPGGIDHPDIVDLRQCVEIRQKPMQLLVVLDPVPIEPARPCVDPREHDRIGLQRFERMLVQFAGLDHHALFGLEPNEPIRREVLSVIHNLVTEHAAELEMAPGLVDAGGRGIFGHRGLQGVEKRRS